VILAGGIFAAAVLLLVGIGRLYLDPVSSPSQEETTGGTSENTISTTLGE
jgi:hypothetical protein